MKARQQGFTLLELLVVVVIIGVLASLALPRFIKTIETARTAEARHWLGVVRDSEVRYRLDHASYTAAIGTIPAGAGNELDIDSPNNDATSNPAYYTYVVTVPGAGCLGDPPGNGFTVTATRVNTRGRPAPPPGVPFPYTITESEKGNFCQTL